MKKRLLLALLSLAASSPSFSALSTNNLGYYFDFNSQSTPGKCIYGSITSPSPIAYHTGALTWLASGGVDDSTRQGGSTAATRPDEIISDSPTVPTEGFTHRIWNFNEQEGWNYIHQNPSGPGSEGSNPEPKSVIEKGILKITVRPDLYDRRKAYVDCNTTTGRYKWRMYLPAPGPGDTCSRASFAAFIYHSDTCEFDFEIARGKQADRNSYGAQNDEMLAMMTSQANPFSSVKTRIKQGWHTVEIDMSNKGGNYYVQWFIDGKVVHTLQTSLAANKPFQIYCSLENLNGTGDYYPKNQTTALFDQVEYYYHP